MEELKRDSNPLAKKLYDLNEAWVKFNRNKDHEKLFDRLLDSVVIAKSLREGIDFVLPKPQQDQEKLLKAIPIVKDQPSEETVYGDGVQGFLHLLLEEKYQNLKQCFGVFPPTATIFNLTPKNFFGNYSPLFDKKRQTGVRYKKIPTY